MTRRPDRAGAAALGLYRDTSVAARLHTQIRWWTAPFPSVEQALPREGRVLEIGCGHGLFSAYAALTAPGRVVHGVDVDGEKIAVAQQIAAPLGDRLTFGRAASGAVPDGPWDAVVIVDVLYLLSEPEQRRLIEAAYAALAAGGVLVVKEMAPTPRWKARWNAAQETVSVKVLRITDGGSFAFVPPDRLAGWLRERGATVELRRLDAGRVHPHHLLVARAGS